MQISVEPPAGLKPNDPSETATEADEWATAAKFESGSKSIDRRLLTLQPVRAARRQLRPQQMLFSD